MLISRRNFIRYGSQFGVAASAAALWSGKARAMVFDQMASDYKAVVLVSMVGGNDCNSLLVPGNAVDYSAITSQRSTLALTLASYYQLYDRSSGMAYGIHPSLTNVASMYAQGRVAAVANIGSLPRPATKSQVLASPNDFPALTFSHAVGVQQWESSQATSYINTGWGGRMADMLSDQSGSVPPVLSAAGRALFTIGSTVQAIALQSGGAFVALPDDLSTAILQNAELNMKSSNEYVKHASELRKMAMSTQVLLGKAASQFTFKTAFPTSVFGTGMQQIAQLIGGRSTIGASRQIFYITQGNYDTHQNQITAQANSLSELDAGLGAFFKALDEIGMSDQVLVCTHSDFGRSLQANATAGTDHGWGGHHLLLGGGISGGRIIGRLPQLVIGGPDDASGNGGWIPTLAVTQLTAAIGGWMGLSASQVGSILPDISNFQDGAIKLI